MTRPYKFHDAQTGFSLVEMAIVLAIVALLLGSLLPTISSQIEQQRRNETRKQLDEIKEALIGYAIIYGSLPCPTTTTDPSNANYGVADAICPPAGATSDGYLPWKTLGVSETDAWGSKRSSAGNSWLGYWRYRVDRNFSTTFSLSTGFSTDKLSVKDNNGNLLTPNTAGCTATSPTSECPVAIVFSTGPNLTADTPNNSTYEASNGIYQSDVPSPTFDDILIWISRPQLFNRMVAAGKLP
jgi:prepilin-type N-terminal cleavage/methylation domain-containing protein